MHAYMHRHSQTQTKRQSECHWWFLIGYTTLVQTITTYLQLEIGKQRKKLNSLTQVWCLHRFIPMRIDFYWFQVVIKFESKIGAAEKYNNNNYTVNNNSSGSSNNNDDPTTTTTATTTNTPTTTATTNNIIPTTTNNYSNKEADRFSCLLWNLNFKLLGNALKQS